MPQYAQSLYRKKFWFGTRNKMQWMDVPLSPADMSPEGWELSGTYLNGGGYSRESGTHKNYIFEWPGSSARATAQIMKDYRDGVYSTPGDPLIYFIDPLIYDQNILPSGWAAPGTWTKRPLQRTPLGVCSPVTRVGNLDLPFTGAQVDTGAGKVWVTAKPDSPVHVAVFYEGAHGVKVNGNVVPGAAVVSGTIMRADAIVLSGPLGLVEIEITGSGYTIWGMKMSLEPVSEWSGGMGHSGVQFTTNPTYIANSGVHGGQIGYAASFKETGSWRR